MSFQFPKEVQFKYEWRKYQKRVLGELTEHLNDNHLHIVAPPGSGKTILGLEVARRLNKPTLILAPTIAIKNQWIRRFCELFLQTEAPPAWISGDIKKPKFLTATTYQALHAAISRHTQKDKIGDPDEPMEDELAVSSLSIIGGGELISLLKEINIGTVIVDEAHHMKNAWWHSLTKVKNALNPTIVGLTATPPYDVSFTEWQRYTDLCGPVDAEITVPELVSEGDLCPHQDFVFFSTPTLEERKTILSYRRNIEKLFNELISDKTLVSAFEKHPYYRNPHEQLDKIYSDIEDYVATLVFLNHAKFKISKYHLEIIGEKNLRLPALDFEWMDRVLTFFLQKDNLNFKAYPDYKKKLISKLKNAGAIEQGTIKLGHSNKINKLISTSLSKLDSISQIVVYEYSQLGNDLRMVILTDYIRKEFLPKHGDDSRELTKLGAVPVFERIRRENGNGIKIGLLTGSIIILPKSAKRAFFQEAQRVSLQKVNIRSFPNDGDYFILYPNQQLRQHLVHIITHIFNDGHIELLIGTKSLLGEGWDAPSINSLILASFVGSYVLSNQMRGRAIRTDRKVVDKSANIWHLTCLDPTDPAGGNEFQTLQRRFKTFVGISYEDAPQIENGISRLRLPEDFLSNPQVEFTNSEMLDEAGKRKALKNKWQNAIDRGSSIIEEMKIPFPKEKKYDEVKSLYFKNTIKNLFATLGSGLLIYFSESLELLARSLKNVRRIEDLLFYIIVLGAIGVAIFGRLTYLSFKTLFKYRDIANDIHQIGLALLEALINEGTIRTPPSELRVISKVDGSGAVYCHLTGGTTYEKSAFIRALKELISPVKNPRYIIIRKSFFIKVIAQRDYHPVPEILGRKKVFAEYFASEWKRFVGSCKLVYTRTVDGRKILLKARFNSLASEFEDKSELVNKWQ